MKKKLAFILFFVVPAFFISAQKKYKISEVFYNMKGKTTQYALSLNIPIDKDVQFNTEDEFLVYLADLRLKFSSERVFDKTSIDYKIDYNSSKDFNLIYLTVNTSDSFNFIAMPYLKYTSNSGLTFKLKMKDMNFLGSMNTMTAETSFAMEQDTESEPLEYVFGAGVTFSYPFKASIVDCTWDNDLSISYTLGDTSPEWDCSSGLTFSIPFDTFDLDFDLTQSAVRDFDYSEYGDDTYFGEDAEFSIPFTVQEIKNWGSVVYTPYISYTSNWDNDGIRVDDTDLISPLYTVGHSISTSRVNWINNFRQGFSFSMSQSISWNDGTQSFVPYIGIELKGYKAFKHCCFSTDLYAFGYSNSEKNIGSRLRGIRDNQYFADGSAYSCKTPQAIVLNLDLPIHIITTDWVKWGSPVLNFIHLGKFSHLLNYFNFEMQISPFIDTALTYNNITKTRFYYKDGFYSGGFEILIFPKKWRSIQVRTMFGIDIGRKFLSKYINTSWRDSDVPKYEWSFGVGLLY